MKHKLIEFGENSGVIMKFTSELIDVYVWFLRFGNLLVRLIQ